MVPETESTGAPSSDQESMVGLRSNKILSSCAACLALPMSGAKEKIVPADWAPKITAEKQTKNWNMSYSLSAIRIPPYLETCQLRGLVG